ncbi:hypothetical protein PFISCL1PPCAC_6777 [Pristionchus fissidentatus]|uniref:Uncharacterized protein n=1 Tax=Pristionchus fissidentatus TaxID=1538716 RepID=A0AAV5VC32_9BILA|nr:hypothetical protein PFISCL1PPCAC_6777 [Pristionchus fissidentatus]
MPHIREVVQLVVRWSKVLFDTYHKDGTESVWTRPMRIANFIFFLAGGVIFLFYEFFAMIFSPFLSQFGNRKIDENDEELRNSDATPSHNEKKEREKQGTEYDIRIQLVTLFFLSISVGIVLRSYQ